MQSGLYDYLSDIMVLRKLGYKIKELRCRWNGQTERNATAGQTQKMNGISVTMMKNGAFLSMMMGSCFHSHIDAKGLFIFALAEAIQEQSLESNGNLDIFRRWPIIKTGGTTNARKRAFETGRAFRICSF